MNEKIVNIREVKARLDPEYYIRTVLDTPEHQARRRARQLAEREAASAREQAIRTADLNALLLKVMLASGAVGFLAAVVGLT